MRKPLSKIKDPSLARRVRRKLSTRSTLSGTAERPRVCPTRSNKHLSIQVIDDVSRKTIASAQTFGKSKVEAKPTVEGAKVLGATIAEKLKSQNITTVVFDRAGYRYHGVIAAIAQSLRDNGIQV